MTYLVGHAGIVRVQLSEANPVTRAKVRGGRGGEERVARRERRTRGGPNTLNRERIARRESACGTRVGGS